MVNAIGYVVAFNGAFIATIGVGSAEMSGHRITSFLFKLIGVILIIIGILMILFIPATAIP
jgi:hypothetical protein